MNLYFLTDETDDGDNLDLFVWAGDPAQAWGLWAQYFSLGEDGDPTIRLIPTDRPLDPRVIDWSDITPI